MVEKMNSQRLKRWNANSSLFWSEFARVTIDWFVWFWLLLFFQLFALNFTVWIRIELSSSCCGGGKWRGVCEMLGKLHESSQSRIA